ncbi:MAG TPA: CAP domain-containing protein [Gaiellaceae bacterium]
MSEKELSSKARVADIKFSILPGLPPLTIRKGSPYPANDSWKNYLASERTCPGGERTDLPLAEQANIMTCLINYARQQRGLSTLSPASLLNETALKKAGKIVRCNEFAHAACGEDPAADVRAFNYYGSWGENLYLGEGRLGAPRVALDGWLNSPEHRENLFRSNWRFEGIAVITAAHIGEYSDATVWVNQFGTT